MTMLSSGTHAAGVTGGNAEFWNTCNWSCWWQCLVLEHMQLESLVAMLSSGTHAAGATGGNAEK